MRKKIIYCFKKDTLLFISAMFALISMMFVKPSLKYFSYIDFRVLSLLFCLMIVNAGFCKEGVFDYFGNRLLSNVKNTKHLVFVLVFLCFFSSMLITNDVSLITFVPFTVLVLGMAKKQNLYIITIVLQTVAANLGSTLTPVGNPQNLYIYSASHMKTSEFFSITMQITILSAILLVIACTFIKNESIEVNVKTKDMPRQKRLIAYMILFLISLITVFRLLTWQVNLIFVICTIIFIDRKLFEKVDYGLILTFVCFFIFIGNMGNISEVRSFVQNVLTSRELIVSALFSQIISNVPAAVLLCGFTKNYQQLLMGVDIGGLGTLIASLASLISYKQYVSIKGADKKKYLIEFSLINILFLLILLLSAYAMISLKII